MSSPCRAEPLALAPALAAVLLVGCNRAPSASAPAAQSGPASTAVSGLFPGGGAQPPLDPAAAAYERNPQAIAEGKRLYGWYNCVGCHFNGGGGIGPALMDTTWRYGGRIDQIYASIYQGRPNGMPAWQGKIPDGQIWEIAAYVKSLSAPNAAQGSSVGAAKANPPTPPPAPAEASPQGVPETIPGPAG